MSRHTPVLLKETVEALSLRPGFKVIDCTLGDAGHSEEILEKIGPNGQLLGIDADVESILRAKRYLYRFETQTKLVKDNFVHLKQIATENGFVPADVVLMDLGWSSPQFEERGRGFSFQKDEPLDMRYNIGCHSEHSEESSRTGGSFASLKMTETAADLLNNSTAEELKKIFKNFGEEELAEEIAAAIAEKRKIKKIEMTDELAELVLQVYRKKLNSDKEIPWVGGIHPATKVFQALRIAVNKELEVLKEVLPQAIEILSPGGRLAIITFHSLEDRIVKQYFQKVNNKTGRIINKKPIIAGDEEVKNNPRARSAKLRIIEKI